MVGQGDALVNMFVLRRLVAEMDGAECAIFPHITLTLVTGRAEVDGFQYVDLA